MIDILKNIGIGIIGLTILILMLGVFGWLFDVLKTKVFVRLYVKGYSYKMIGARIKDVFEWIVIFLLLAFMCWITGSLINTFI
jgi:hypothetical protein